MDFNLVNHLVDKLAKQALEIAELKKNIERLEAENQACLGKTWSCILNLGDHLGDRILSLKCYFL